MKNNSSTTAHNIRVLDFWSQANEQRTAHNTGRILVQGRRILSQCKKGSRSPVQKRFSFADLGSLRSCGSFLTPGALSLIGPCTRPIINTWALTFCDFQRQNPSDLTKKVIRCEIWITELRKKEKTSLNCSIMTDMWCDNHYPLSSN